MVLPTNLSPLARRSAAAPSRYPAAAPAARYVSSRCAEPCRTGRGCHQGCRCEACSGQGRSSDSGRSSDRYTTSAPAMAPQGFMMPNIVINVQSGNRSSNDYQTFDSHANDEMHYSAPVTAPVDYRTQYHSDYRPQLISTPQPQVAYDQNGTPVVMPPRETVPVVASRRVAAALLPPPPPDTTPRYYREFP